ncbi:MAG: ATP-binding protein [Thermoleophilia bacterium]
MQVSVFADRVEVWNPGALPPGLTPARLREPHGSVARNPRICEALFLTGYIEKYGTGTLMMIRESIENGLPEPDFEQRGGEFVVTAWRDWPTFLVRVSSSGSAQPEREPITSSAKGPQRGQRGHKAEVVADCDHLRASPNQTTFVRSL